MGLQLYNEGAFDVGRPKCSWYQRGATVVVYDCFHDSGEAGCGHCAILDLSKREEDEAEVYPGIEIENRSFHGHGLWSVDGPSRED